MNIVIVYHSEDGHTEKLARAVAAGALGVPGAHVEVMTVEQASADHLRKADGILLGCPVYSGTVSHQMKKFIDTTMGELWFAGELSGKTGGAFAAGGGEHGGLETTLETLLRTMLGFNMCVTGPYVPQEAVRTSGAVYGATYVPQPGQEDLSPDDRKLAASLGRRVAEIAGALAASGAGEEREGTLRHAA
ncbi:MAG TPA: NAD(P)H-dependent oxidoreductase [Armatimonadota bacterium]|nr:NAD(P)H-dependent oxidoreductase [Armatimonadota bacterium]